MKKCQCESKRRLDATLKIEDADAGTHLYYIIPCRSCRQNIQDVLGTLTPSNAYDFLHGITSNYTNHWDFDTNHWDFDFVLVKMT